MILPKFILAPMAEITTPALRSAIRGFAPDTLMFTEMLSAHLIIHGGRINRFLLAQSEDEQLVFQLLGSNAEEMREAALILAEHHPLGIDINMGCSAPEILKSRCGAHLLREPETARDIVRTLRSVVKTPLSVKMRAGVNSAELAFTLDFCQMLQDEGVDFITIHPRALRQGFRGGADWKIIRAVKEQISIPVIGSGDIVTAEGALSRFSFSGCDAVMIGRAAVQKPWIFALCDNLLNGSTPVGRIDLAQLNEQILETLAGYLPDELHQSRAHRFLFYYTKNFRFGHPLMNKIRQETAIPEMIRLVNEYCERNPDERWIELS